MDSEVERSLKDALALCKDLHIDALALCKDLHIIVQQTQLHHREVNIRKCIEDALTLLKEIEPCICISSDPLRHKCAGFKNYTCLMPERREEICSTRYDAAFWANMYVSIEEKKECEKCGGEMIPTDTQGHSVECKKCDYKIDLTPHPTKNSSDKELASYNIECPRYHNTQCTGDKCLYWSTKYGCTREPHTKDQNRPPDPIEDPDDPGSWVNPHRGRKFFVEDEKEGKHPYDSPEARAAFDALDESEPPTEEATRSYDEYFAETKRHEIELMGGAPDHLLDRAYLSLQGMLKTEEPVEEHDPGPYAWECPKCKSFGDSVDGPRPKECPDCETPIPPYYDNIHEPPEVER